MKTRALLSWCLAGLVAGAAPYHAPPGRYHTSWVGNSFPGDGGPNGFGFWVQNGADEIEVSPEGTVVAGTDWDEAGRCVGLYRDGKMNRVLLKQESREETAWGWNTGNHAIAVDGTNLFVGNKGGRLLRFTWTPGELDSAVFAEEFRMPEPAIGLSVRNGRLAAAFTNRVEVGEAAGYSEARRTSVAVPGVRDVVVAPDGAVWVIASNAVRRLELPPRDSSTGTTPAAAANLDNGTWCPEVAKPTAVAFAHDGRLVVCDEGPDQQVKFYDVRGPRPKLVGTLGDRGGLRSGTPGRSAPTKLYAPRGAGTDAAGNVYVALGFDGAPVGTLVLRSFTPDGTLRWELSNHAFVDTYGFDPAADGAVIYSRTAVFDLNLEGAAGTRIWRQRATTVDHVTHPDDPRANSAMTASLRHLAGRRLLATIGQYGGGFRWFVFDGPESYLARPAGQLTAEGETWAWHLADNGDVWHGDWWRGDQEGGFLRRFPFLCWTEDGRPRYGTEKPDIWPWPADFKNVRRVLYEEASDTLFLSGYLKGQEIDSWGVSGKTLRRYDGWMKGARQERWTLQLPMNPDGDGPGKPLSPNSLALAGEYLFVGMVKPEEGRQQVHILRRDDGAYVGTFVPGPEVGGNAGWQDMPYAVAAMKRRNGEYLVLVEEDWRGKNLLYRWTPDAK